MIVNILFVYPLSFGIVWGIVLQSEYWLAITKTHPCINFLYILFQFFIRIFSSLFTILKFNKFDIYSSHPSSHLPHFTDSKMF